MNLLIVDDHAINRKLLRMQLETEGHRVLEAADGVEALEILDRESVDGVVSDVLMPGLDGFRLCLEIRKRKNLARLPFVLYTATFKTPQDRELARRVGADQYLTKPSTVREIIGALEHAMQTTRDRIAVGAARHDESYVLKQYNEALVRKLGERNLELEEVLKNLRIAHDGKQESAQRFRAIFDNAGVGISMRPAHDRNLPWVQVNDHFCNLLGYTRDELLKLNTVDITPADGQASAVSYNQRLLSDDIAGYSREKQIVRKDGQRIWVSLTVASSPSSDGRPANLISTYQDISERKAAEDKVRRLSRIRALSSGINAAIVHTTNRQELLDETCRIAVEHGGFGIAWVGKYDAATLDVNPISFAGVSPDQFTRKSTVRPDVSEGQGAMGRAIRERKPVFINDLTLDPAVGGQRREEAVRRGYRSLIALPLIVGGEVFGNLTMFTKELNFFNDEEVVLMTELAASISFALESIERKEKIDRLSRVRAVSSEINAAIVHARDPMSLFTEACRIAVEQGRLGSAWIGALDAVTLDITPVAWAGEGTEEMRTVKSTARDDPPRGQGAVSLAVRERRVVVDNDLSLQNFGGPRREAMLKLGFNSLIALPLFKGGAIVGTFSLCAKESGFFDENEITLLTELVGNVSLALDHMAQQQRIEKLSRIRAVSSEINTAIVRVRNPQELFEEACRIAVEQGRLGSAWIGTMDPATLDITPVAWAGEGTEEMRTVKSTARDDPPRGQGAVSRAVRECRAIFNNDLAKQSFGGPRRDAVLKLGFRSMIALPLLAGDKVIGTFTLYAMEPGFFDADEVALLTELAGNVSFALEHMARQQRIEKLSRIRAISSAINAAIIHARNRQELFEQACRIAVERGRLGSAWIGLLNQATLDIVPVAWAGEGSEEMRSAVSTARDDPPRGQGAVSRAIRERRAIFNNDLANQSFGGTRREAILKLGYHSLIALPLFEGDAIIGTFSLHAKEPGFFDADEVALLTELAGNVSFALEHLARQEKLEKQSRIRAVSSEINVAIVRVRERDDLLKNVCRIVSEQGKIQMIWIGTIDQEKREIKPVSWKGFSDEIAHRVNWESIEAAQGTLRESIRTRKASVRNNIESEIPVGGMRGEALKQGCRSTVSLPLMVGDRVVALISLFATGAGYFDRDELALLDEVASNISFALEQIEREEKFTRLSRIESVMGSISGLIVRADDRDELFRESCRIVVDEGRFCMSLIGIVDPNSMKIVPVASAGKDEGLLASIKGILSSEDAPKTMIARAIREKKPVVSNDSLSDSRVIFSKKYAESGIRSMAVMPLIVSDDAVGVLALYADETGFFDDEEMKLLTELTGNIAFAIDHFAKQERLDYLAYYDTLTGLANRTLFLERVALSIRSAASGGHKLAMFLIDLDRFKNINDSLGRQAGDALLKQVAEWMTRNLGGASLLARVDADHFAVLLPEVRQDGDVVRLIEKSMEAFMEHSFGLRDAVFRIAAKVGVAVFPDDGADADTLFRNAEAALKKAKSSGNQYMFYTQKMTEAVAGKLALENQLREALDQGEFVLHYQPKVDLASGAVCGLEALIRWQKPGAGLVAPGVFIPLLEETGLILGVGKWALSKALAQHREWTARGIAAPRIAVNVSAIQLQQKDFSAVVTGVLQAQGGNPDALELEVTESLLMQDVHESIRTLSILRALGIHIAMDDFGTGYSSLAYLARLPINSLKIDRSFITEMAKSPQDMGIVTTIIALAHSMNLKVVAEGVETGKQSQLLKLLKCDEAQGYLFSKPLPAAEIEPLLRALAAEASVAELVG